MTSPKITRRMLLEGAGVGAAALSCSYLRWMPSALAQSAPKRLVVFYTPNEPMNESFWRPVGATHNAALPATLEVPAGTNNAQFNVLEPLVPFRNKLSLFADLEMKMAAEDLAQPYSFKSGHRGLPWVLTGVINKYNQDGTMSGGGISLDQFIADRWNTQALVLGVLAGGGANLGRMSYTGPSQPVNPYDNPREAFDALFGNFEGTPEEGAVRRAQQKRMFDAVGVNINAMQSRLPQEDRIKLEKHLESMNNLRARLDHVVSCDDLQRPDAIASNNANLPQIARAQLDVIAQALACDVRRIAVLQLGNSGASNLYPQNWDGLTDSRNTHNMAHEFNGAWKNGQKTGDVILNRVKLEKFYYSLFAYLLGKLNAIPEGTGTLLDNTIVLWCKNLGYGHSWTKMPFFVAGGGNGMIQQGKYIRHNGRGHNDLLSGIANALGVSINTFGDPNYNSGPITL